MFVIFQLQAPGNPIASTEMMSLSRLCAMCHLLTAFETLKLRLTVLRFFNTASLLRHWRSIAKLRVGTLESKMSIRYVLLQEARALALSTMSWSLCAYFTIEILFFSLVLFPQFIEHFLLLFFEMPISMNYWYFMSINYSYFK